MYIVRTVSGALRLGVADMTILDALALACCGTKDARGAIERAYNVSSDLGNVAEILASGGLGELEKLRPTPGRPIRPMLAERLSSSAEILEKMGGKCAVEYKYDGERVQIHLGEGDARLHLFSRRLENIDHHYPDVAQIISRQVDSKSYIIEGEIVAIDPSTSELLPFQELMHRRRKYDVEKAMVAYPIAVILFDALVIAGRDLTKLPYPERRSMLSKIVKEAPTLRMAEQSIVDDASSMERFFEDAISNGCEGIVAKSVGSESLYNAGARGWLWIKYKRDYKSEMHDTVDLAVVGAIMGTGKRAGYMSSLLLAAYSKDEDIFKTVCKCSTGFTDEDLKSMKSRFEKQIIPHRHARVDSKIVPDIWLAPYHVIEILGAEITLSPIHTCGTDAIRPGAGLAVRFPRFTGNWREDKRAEDATTVVEIIDMYKKQLKKISN
jgi:DNA ligase-1